MQESTMDALIAESLALEAESAKEAGTIGYMARALVQATMPHRQTTAQSHVRANGDFRLMMTAVDPDIGLPYGSIPRVLMAWIGAEAIRTRQKELLLSENMSAFLRELGMVPSGGQWGTITRLKDQTLRLLNCAIKCSYTDTDHYESSPMINVGHGSFWWDAKQDSHTVLFQSTITLSDAFFDELLNHAVPVDIRALKLLSKSPLALDIYSWLTYRIYTLNRSRRDSVMIPWVSLQMQFGSGYPMTTRGTLDFKRKFLAQLTNVKALVYTDARTSDDKAGLTLYQSPQHLPSRTPKLPHQK